MKLQNKDHNFTWNPLYEVVDDHVDKGEFKSKNTRKAWKYGYDEKNDMVVISKDGTIGEIYDINGVKIALPSTPKNLEVGANKWKSTEVPSELKKIQSISEWKLRDDEFKSKYIDYIEGEFDHRANGFWFINNSVPTYITGHHYMYLQHTKIDVGHPDFREANRILFIYWEACRADNRCYGIIYLKIRRSGFSFMGASVSVDMATLLKDSRIGILSKTGDDAKKMFVNKVVPISKNYPFFFSPIQSGMDKPKTELVYSIPAKKITKKNMNTSDLDGDEGLDTSIDWKNTDENSYDGEKLKLLVDDEIGKWVAPNNIKKNWGVTKTCLRLGKKIIGKVFAGSTCNALAKGGQNFKDLYEGSNPRDRSKNGQTKTGMYALFIPMEHNMEGFIDEYGHPVFVTPEKPVLGVDGEMIDQGAINFWQNEVDAQKNDPDALNEHYRQYPRTESHAFRDESKASIFNLTKIYDQVEYNDSLIKDRVITRGNFHWKGGIKDSEVVWTPDPRGNFTTSWIPSKTLQNRYIKKNGMRYPGNDSIGLFGCDSYDISATVGGRGSNGALHGLTKSNMTDEAPSNEFFLEYIHRPSTAEEFFEDVLMAIVFYGMPILVENNKPRLLYHLKNRGYRGYSLNRPDKSYDKLSKTEKELGGIPNTSEDVKQVHADSIQSWIEEYVGYDREGTYRSDPEECGTMPFSRTLADWARFDINNRTKHDASISSGLAIMATRKHKLTPTKEKSKIKLKFVSYNNSGQFSEIKR